MQYCTEELAKGTRLNHLTRHILGLYQGLPGARQFRRIISEQAHKPDAGIEVLERALAALNELPLANTVDAGNA
jgi:tRNA-dihydrouridine synthase A